MLHVLYLCSSVARGACTTYDYSLNLPGATSLTPALKHLQRKGELPLLCLWTNIGEVDPCDSHCIFPIPRFNHGQE